MATRTDSLEQQTLQAIYDAAVFYAEKYRMNNLTCCLFLDASRDERQGIFDAWDAAGRPEPLTEACMEWMRTYFSDEKED